MMKNLTDMGKVNYVFSFLFWGGHNMAHRVSLRSDSPASACQVLELKGCIATLYPSAVKVSLVEDIGYMVHAYMLGVNKLMYGIHNTLFTKYTYCM